MSTVLEQLQYGFDRNSRRTWQRRSLTDTQDQHYGYDSLGQVSAAARGSLNFNLTAISGRPASAQGWDYDPTGNWRGYHSASNGTTTLDQHRVHDRGNRLTQIEGNPSSMILDRVGRMRQMAPDADGDWDGTLELTWDAWSRITSVKNNGEVVGDYAYDGRHRRITREVDAETLHSYYNDAWRPVEERKDSETTASISYLWGARHRDDLVRRDRAVGGTMLNETRYVLMDYFNPAAITDEAGEVKERYAFSAFGLRTILNPDFTVSSSSECGFEFAFQGQFLDAESGLMNYGYRYYSPQLGRWTCKDPIGESGERNMYRMVNNGAINTTDFLGLKDKCCVAESPKYKITTGKLGKKGVVNDVQPSKDIPGNVEVSFEFNAKFINKGDCCCRCCSIRQEIKWNNAAAKPDHAGFGPTTPEWPYKANKSYEDRGDRDRGSPEIRQRYGHRDDMASKNPNITATANHYTQSPVPGAPDAEGCNYFGKDTPSVASGFKGVWTFSIKVIDTCDKSSLVGKEDVIHVNWG